MIEDAEIQTLKKRVTALEAVICAIPGYIDNWAWVRENRELLETIPGWECPFQEPPK